MNKQSSIFIGIGVLILAGLGYFLFKPSATAPERINNQNQIPNIQNEATTGAAPITKDIFEAEFHYLSSGYEPKSVRVEQGQKVMLKITSDTADDAHFHGYDLSKPVLPGQEAIIEFTADKTGRFELELEKSAKSLGFIEVYPK